MLKFTKFHIAIQSGERNVRRLQSLKDRVFTGITPSDALFVLKFGSLKDKIEAASARDPSGTVWDVLDDTLDKDQVEKVWKVLSNAEEMEVKIALAKNNHLSNEFVLRWAQYAEDFEVIAALRSKVTRSMENNFYHALGTPNVNDIQNSNTTFTPKQLFSFTLQNMYTDKENLVLLHPSSSKDVAERIEKVIGNLKEDNRKWWWV